MLLVGISSTTSLQQRALATPYKEAARIWYRLLNGYGALHHILLLRNVLLRNIQHVKVAPFDRQALLAET